MKAVILAAGEGNRLRPLTIKTPKPMLRVLDKPLLEHIIGSFPKEIDELIIVVGYLKEQIQDYFGDSWKGRKITYVWQKKKTGTAHALKLCKPALGKGRFLMTFADDLHGKGGIRDALKKEFSLVVAKVGKDIKRFGEVRLSEDGSVSGIVEKPDNPISDLGSTGAMVLDHKIFNYKAKKHKNGEYYLTECINKMAKEYKMYPVIADFWLPIAYPKDLEKAEKVLKRKTPLRGVFI
jgi:UDP-N-acetylglucosamine diphosphorylase / glucose-1-phosphate thymidylyltransferase / UDP-N-acetylgalactosamine diphosphorylase / glucosamine-1-phosphate N-acetyltransferase / galactosamine-1-phosphate N-acetyltransferase